MTLRPLLCSLLALTSPFLLADHGAQNRFAGLMNNSPFGRSGEIQTKDTAAGDPLEFRAVLEERGSKFFSIYETTTHRSVWVDLNETANGFSVKAYDEEHAFVTVEYQGKTLTLPLKGAANHLARSAGLATLPETSRAAPKDKSTELPFRIGHVADEVAIRQAVRISGVANPVSPVPPKAPAKR